MPQDVIEGWEGHGDKAPSCLDSVRRVRLGLATGPMGACDHGIFSLGFGKSV